VSKIPGTAPIQGPIMGINSDQPAIIPRTRASGTPIIIKPIVTAIPTNIMIIN